MTDDLVIRLRDLADCWEMREAADEIERLRELLWKYENCEMVCESPCEPDWDDGECETCDKHRKEVRGD